ncbi:hypothetical protein ABZ769_29770 [Streptomyces olivoreticuli]
MSAVVQAGIRLPVHGRDEIAQLARTVCLMRYQDGQPGCRFPRRYG